MPTVEVVNGISRLVNGSHGRPGHVEGNIRDLRVRSPGHNILLTKFLGGPRVEIRWPVENQGTAPGTVRMWVTSSTTGFSRQSVNLTLAPGIAVNAFMSIKPQDLLLLEGETARYFAQMYDNTNGLMNTVLSGHVFDVTLAE